VNTVLGNLKGNIVGVTRWVGKAHLDRYLAEFQYRFNRRIDLESILPRLLHEAVGTAAMPQPLLNSPGWGRPFKLRLAENQMLFFKVSNLSCC
jgi:hypothetical protein